MESEVARRALVEFVAGESAAAAPPLTARWVERFRAMPGVAAVLFYGSGLRDHGAQDPEVVYDFYLLVDRYRDFSASWGLAAAGSLVPPNVYYFEDRAGDQPLRCKVAVLTVAQFCAEAREGAFTPHIWARFCQPSRILFARDEPLRARLNEALADCLVTFHRRTLSLVESCPVGTFWNLGLKSTYADEIRSERRNRPTTIYATHEASFRARTRETLRVLPALGWLDEQGNVRSRVPAGQRRRDARRLRLARPLKKGVIVLRLLKAAFSFEGALDYALWKVERHSGVRFELNPFHRRHPVLGGLVLFFKAARQGALR